MVDKITKVLRKLSVKERKQIKALLNLLGHNQLNHLHIKKLKGRSDIFRARQGSVRVIFRKTKRGTTKILAVERRTDVTYKSF